MRYSKSYEISCKVRWLTFSTICYGEKLWELWNSDTQGPSMNSRNHIMFGTISSWFYRYLCGVDVPLGSRGYDNITIRPVGVGIPGAMNLTSASCSVLTPHGKLSASWQGPAVPGPAHGELTCGQVAESTTLSLACPVGVIETVIMAT